MLARIFEPTAVPSSAHCLQEIAYQRLDREAAGSGGVLERKRRVSPWPGHDTRWLARGLPRFPSRNCAKGQPAPTSLEHKPPAGCSPLARYPQQQTPGRRGSSTTRTVRPGYRAIRQFLLDSALLLTQL